MDEKIAKIKECNTVLLNHKPSSKEESEIKTNSFHSTKLVTSSAMKAIKIAEMLQAQLKEIKASINTSMNIYKEMIYVIPKISTQGKKLTSALLQKQGLEY